MPEQLPGVAEAEYRRHMTIGTVAQVLGGFLTMASVVFGDRALEATNTVDASVRGGIGFVLLAAGVGLLAGGAKSFIGAGEYKAWM